mmetsp:Transcript_8045/g.23944  ORF Transcript_8045/g.23944 Transcript_8045/m.23944 type:complete len:447 (-) Transcript_8045:902-2242(-)
MNLSLVSSPPIPILVHPRHGWNGGALLLVQSMIMDRPVLHLALPRLLVKVRYRMLHPFIVVPVGIILVRVRPPTLLPYIRAVHGRAGVRQQIAQFQSLDEICVPYQRTIGHSDVRKGLYDLVDLTSTLLEQFRRTVDRGVILHDRLHLAANFGRGGGSVGVPKFIEIGETLHARAVGSSRRVRDVVARSGQVGDAECARSSEHDNVQEGIGPEAIGPVDRRARRLSRREESGHDLVLLEFALGIELGPYDLAVMVGRDTSHIVVDRGEDGDGFLRHVDSRKDGGRLGNAGETFGEQVRRKMIEMKIDVILLGTNAPSLPNFHRHGTGNDVPAGEILRRRGVPFHESFALGIAKDAALAAATLGDETSRAVDTRGVKLDEFRILIGESRSHGHGVAVARARVRAGAGEVRPAVPPRGEDGVVRLDPVDGPVLHIECHDADAPSVVGH